MMTTYFEDSESKSWSLPADFAHDDVRLSEDVVERYIRRFTDVGNTVFDPFAGFGTTLVVAERMGRIGIGCEISAERARYAAAMLSNSRILTGDIREVGLETISADLIVSSPPYMNRDDKEDPLRGYAGPVESYGAYVAMLAEIYVRVADCLMPRAQMVIQLQNLRNPQGVTPLAFDLHARIGDRLLFQGEEVTLWGDECYGYSHGYCLIYGRG